MKLTNGQAFDAFQAVAELAGLKNLRGRASYRVAKIYTALKPEVVAIEQGRQRIIEEATVRGEDGEPVPVTGADGTPAEGRVQLTDAGAEELRELMLIETEVAVDPIPLDDLDVEGIAPETFARLGPLVIDG